jgi:hypothetical protein
MAGLIKEGDLIIDYMKGRSCIVGVAQVTAEPSGIQRRHIGYHRRCDQRRIRFFVVVPALAEDWKKDEPALVSAVGGAGSAMLFSVAAAI